MSRPEILDHLLNRPFVLRAELRTQIMHIHNHGVKILALLEQSLLLRPVRSGADATVVACGHGVIGLLHPDGGRIPSGFPSNPRAGSSGPRRVARERLNARRRDPWRPSGRALESARFSAHVPARSADCSGAVANEGCRAPPARVIESRIAMADSFFTEASKD